VGVDLRKCRVALFVPCYVDQLYPDVGFAALELLESQGVRVEVPPAQTCCGQPLTNKGAIDAARGLGASFEATFAPYDYVVCPSGSCTGALHRHAEWLGVPADGAAHRVLELCQFLTEIVGSYRPPRPFPHRVALHQSCHALRDLGLGAPSELGAGSGQRENPARRLLESVPEIRLVDPERTDECCGFGGSFCVVEPEVSSRMGGDRVSDFERAGAEVVTSADMSCLMHLSGIMRRQRRPLVALHIAQVLIGRSLARARAQ
jgi:L-lactate dehydrogenase complex protein LldE